MKGNHVYLASPGHLFEDNEVKIVAQDNKIQIVAPVYITK